MVGRSAFDQGVLSSLCGLSQRGVLNESPQLRSLLRSPSHRLTVDPERDARIRRAVVAAFMCGADRPHKLHVLLRHRLLLQAYRVEGFGAVEIDLGAGDHPIPEGEHACVDDLDLRRASLDPRETVVGHEHTLSCEIDRLTLYDA